MKATLSVLCEFNLSNDRDGGAEIRMLCKINLVALPRKGDTIDLFHTVIDEWVTVESVRWEIADNGIFYPIIELEDTVIEPSCEDDEIASQLLGDFIARAADLDLNLGLQFLPEE